MEIISGIRNCRAQWGIKPHQETDVIISTPSQEQLSALKPSAALLQRLIKIKKLEFSCGTATLKDTASGVAGEIKFFIRIGDVIDVAQEKKRIDAERNNMRQAAEAIERRLDNADFLKKAPAEVVCKDKERLEGLRIKMKNLDEVIANLS